MRKIKFTTIILVISVFFLIGTVGNMLNMIQAYHQTENNTTLYSATISKVEINNEMMNVKIWVNEYDYYLTIPRFISEEIIDEAWNLQIGQKIFFRIENFKVDAINSTELINIVSLKTENEDIFTLDEYNKIFKHESIPTQIAATIVALLSMVSIGYCIVSNKKNAAKSK